MGQPFFFGVNPTNTLSDITGSRDITCKSPQVTSYLTRWDVRHVRALLSDIKEKWYDIGVELEIDIDRLSKIKMKHGDDKAACLLEMITLWLKFIKNQPKWETLAAALRCRVINEEELAKKGTKSNAYIVYSHNNNY